VNAIRLLLDNGLGNRPDPRQLIVSLNAAPNEQLAGLVVAGDDLTVFDLSIRLSAFASAAFKQAAVRFRLIAPVTANSGTFPAQV
jgi:hypothetical protein